MPAADAEIAALGKDIEIAIRARGRNLARAAGPGKGADLIIAMFDDAADVAALHTQLARINGSHPATHSPLPTAAPEAP